MKRREGESAGRGLGGSKGLDILERRNKTMEAAILFPVSS